MDRLFKWGIAICILFLGAFVFIIQREYAEIRQLEKEAAESQKMLEDYNKTKIAIEHAKQNQKPADEPGFEWVRHGDHWDKVPIVVTEDQPIVENDVSKTEPPQVESIVIDGIGDLKEHLAYLESLGDDPPLEDSYEYTERGIQFGVAMRSFDMENASPEVLALIRQILEKSTSLGYVFGEKGAAARAEYEANRLATTDPKYIYGPIIAVDEEGNE